MPKAIWAGGSSDNPGDYFKNGDVGIYFSGSWNYNPFVQDITSFKFGVMPSPVGSAGGSAILGDDVPEALQTVMSQCELWADNIMDVRKKSYLNDSSGDEGALRAAEDPEQYGVSS